MDFHAMQIGMDNLNLVIYMPEGIDCSFCVAEK